MNRDIAEWFGEYARLIAERFSDRVTHFFTLNEPQCFVGLGFLSGVHAPGLKCPMRDTFEMAHNALRAHGRAVQMLRQYAKQPLIIGYAPTSGIIYPASDRILLENLRWAAPVPLPHRLFQIPALSKSGVPVYPRCREGGYRQSSDSGLPGV